MHKASRPFSYERHLSLSHTIFRARGPASSARDDRGVGVLRKAWLVRVAAYV